MQYPCKCWTAIFDQQITNIHCYLKDKSSWVLNNYDSWSILLPGARFNLHNPISLTTRGAVTKCSLMIENMETSVDCVLFLMWDWLKQKTKTKRHKRRRLMITWAVRHVHQRARSGGMPSLKLQKWQQNSAIGKSKCRATDVYILY